MLALEYIAKFFIILVVIVVVVSLLLKFYSSAKLCFFDCEKKVSCDVKATVASVDTITVDTIQKYCILCFEKSRECKKNVLCYVINGNFIPSYFQGLDARCEVTCNKQATSLLFEYDWIKNKVLIEC